MNYHQQIQAIEAQIKYLDECSARFHRDFAEGTERMRQIHGPVGVRSIVDLYLGDSQVFDDLRREVEMLKWAQAMKSDIHVEFRNRRQALDRQRKELLAKIEAAA